MAYLVGTRKIYLFVKSEDNSVATTASTHSVENGADISDHVKMNAETVSVSGMLVGSSYMNSVAIIKSWEKDGTLVRYSGDVILKQCRISSFQLTHEADTAGGCSFTMELESVRIAKPAYTVSELPAETKPTDNAGAQSVEVNNSGGVYHTVKAGDTVWALVNGPYKKYGKSCDDIMRMNPGAFSRAGDFRTLQIGARLKMGD